MKNRRAPQEPLAAELAAQRALLEGLLGQVTLLAERLTVMRADQLRLLADRGMAPADAPDIHRCSDPEHHHPTSAHPVGPAAVKARNTRGSRKKKAGERHGR